MGFFDKLNLGRGTGANNQSGTAKPASSSTAWAQPASPLSLLRRSTEMPLAARSPKFPARQRFFFGRRTKLPQMWQRETQEAARWRGLHRERLAFFLKRRKHARACLLPKSIWGSTRRLVGRELGLRLRA